MAFNEQLAERLRRHLKDADVTEKHMFGGVAFLIQGNMALGVTGDELMVRVGPDAYEECLALPNAREMDFTGRALKGFIYVSPAGIGVSTEFAAWIQRGVAFALSLPPK